MFITDENFCSPLTSLLSDEKVKMWSLIELDRKAPWYLINVRESDIEEATYTDAFFSVRTLIVGTASHVRSVIKANANSRCRFNAVYAVVPEHSGDYLDWRIEQVRSVLEAENPLDRRIKVELLETVSGRLVPTFSIGVPVQSLRILGEVFRCPVRSAPIHVESTRRSPRRRFATGSLKAVR
jgi:hypothetical protein